MTVQLDIPPFVQRDLDEMAKRNGVSPNEIMVIAIAEKLSAMRAAEEMTSPEREQLRKRFREVLLRVPNQKPMKGDEIPAELRAKIKRFKERSRQQRQAESN